MFEEYGYVLDPHTSVAHAVAMTFLDYERNDNPTVVLSTASPYKFAHDVLKAIKGSAPEDAFKASAALNLETAAPIPEQITALKNKKIRFNDVVEKEDAANAVMKFIVK